MPQASDKSPPISFVPALTILGPSFSFGALYSHFLSGETELRSGGSDESALGVWTGASGSERVMPEISDLEITLSALPVEVSAEIVTLRSDSAVIRPSTLSPDFRVRTSARIWERPTCVSSTIRAIKTTTAANSFFTYSSTSVLVFPTFFCRLSLAGGCGGGDQI